MVTTIIGIILFIYFTPAIIAVFRRSPHLSQIFITNLFLGWSVIFWVFSFRHAMGWENSLDQNNPGK